MKKKYFCILGILLFPGFQGGSYAHNLSHFTFFVGNHAHTTPAFIHYEPLSHTPAHGHRHQHDHNFQFNAELDVYIATGNPGLYFYNGYYIRFHSEGWQISHYLSDSWHSAHQNHIPHNLRKHHAQLHRHDNRYHDDETHHTETLKQSHHQNH